MSLLTSIRVTSPVSLIVPIKSRTDAAELAAVLHLAGRQVVDWADAVGTLHFARWLNLHEQNQFAFFSAFDGSLRQHVENVARYLGPLFDVLYKHVLNGPPLPVGENVDAFYRWVAANNLDVSGFYSAYPTLSVREIRTASGITCGTSSKGAASPLTLIMRAKSANHLRDASRLITQTWLRFCGTADEIGTLHFARFLSLGEAVLTYISEYDGAFDKHVLDLSAHMGPLFDQILENLGDSPPTPVGQNTTQFAKWISSHNAKPLWFYNAYPSLSVQDIRTRATRVVQKKKEISLSNPQP